MKSPTKFRNKTLTFKSKISTRKRQIKLKFQLIAKLVHSISQKDFSNITKKFGNFLGLWEFKKFWDAENKEDEAQNRKEGRGC